MYEDYYRFSAKPFQLNPDPRFFYGSKGHKRAMAYLDYGLSLGEGFIVITGEVGAGKTTLVRNLFSQLDAHSLVAAQLVSTQLDAEDTLRSVAASFGLAHEGLTKSALLKNLEDFLVAAARQGKRALLVVDEAQNLTPRAVEELRMLSNYQNNERSLIQTFLLGQPEFRGILQSPDMQQLRQRVVASYHLGPLDAGETRGYIEHRLHTVGWQGNPNFDEAAFSALHCFAGGIPRRINTTCDRLLLFGFLEEKSHFGEAEVNEVIADLRNEVAHQDYHGATGVNNHPPEGGTLHHENSIQLVQRIDQVERSVNRILPIVRKILFTVSERSNTVADEGALPDGQDIAH
ncbi:MAG: XrtA-associated ATPase [Thiobacillus sp.]|jgi:putative secretion ATPase (PEP-CTERM system associated)|uniref:XrtA/PEP-CTERM system-associated ATPase n=1 Tax=Thiobacillus sp. TaxID=924 RepID=UPI002894BF94|nr:XrtA/PEP-CTERM system-associated ATPase [Thiobacillus sp.]MDT3706876.1 XrtA-associated ATPase [Thiobacillus sp.]